MKIKSCFFLVVGSFSIFSWSLAAVNTVHLNGGRPGCWDEIRSSALSSDDVKGLSPDCQNLRSDYLKSIDQADQKPSEYLKQLNRALTHSKKAAPPYEAILFAVLSQSQEVKSGLKARALIEQKLKLPFRYAEVALFRLAGKSCDEKPDYLHPFYREVCTGRDSVLSTSLTVLNHSQAGDSQK